MRKSLATTNPYLRKPTLKKEMVKRFVVSSSAIEGIHITSNKKISISKKRATSTRHKA